MVKIVAFLLLAIALFASTPVMAQSPAITPVQLANLSYSGIYDEPITLVDGVYEGDPTQGQAHVELTDQVVTGDFDGDGSEDTAVILVENSGGTGNFYYLAVFSTVDGTPTNVGTVLLGNRVIIDDFATDDLGVKVDLTMSGPLDALCCPTMQVSQSYMLLDDGLHLATQTILGSTTDDSGPIPIETLANLSYPLDLGTTQAVTLTDGVSLDDVNATYVTMALPPAYGDFNGDGVLDAVVLLDYSGGGSGRFVYLYAVVNNEGVPEPVASTLLGDRVQINSVGIEDGQIILDLITHGPLDAACCPTQETTNVYVLSDDTLVQKVQSDQLITQLGALAYPSTITGTGSITLTDGIYIEATEAVSDSRTIAQSGYLAAGDLDGDSDDDAATILVTTSGDGTASFDLYPVRNDDGVWTVLTPTIVGSGIEILDLNIADGEIVLGAKTPAPEDDPCCPTQIVEQRYTLQDQGLNLDEEQQMEAVLAGAAEIVPGGEFDPNGAALAATINSGDTPGMWLDPYLVSVQSGVTSVPAVDAQTLGEGCTGYIPAQPDVVLNWNSDEVAEMLRLFTLSAGDPVLVVVTPSGEVICNDDYSPLVPDSYIEIPTPEAGRYAIFVGNFADSAVTPGFLAISSQDLSPASLDLSRLLPNAVGPSLARVSLPIESMMVLSDPQASAEEPLGADNTPYKADVVAGGELPAFDVELGNSLCTGFISPEPTFSFTWQVDEGTIALMFEAESDTTLIMRTPDGVYQCDDDADGANNLNPALDFAAASGDYLVWVGSFDPTVQPEGTLTIGSEALTPVALPVAQE